MDCLIVQVTIMQNEGSDEGFANHFLFEGYWICTNQVSVTCDTQPANKMYLINYRHF